MADIDSFIEPHYKTSVQQRNKKKVTFSDVYIYHTTYEMGSDFRKGDQMALLWKRLEKQKNEILLAPILSEEHRRAWQDKIKDNKKEV